MFAVPSFFGYNTTFVSTPVATAATGVGETSFTANWNAFAGATYYLLDVSTSSSFSSFVLEDEVVLAPTTAYLVAGLTANTTYYYRLRASTDPYFDPDAAAFFSRVTTAGGTLTTTEQNAVNTLVLDMKAAGIWTAMKAIYPMVGGGTGSTAAREAACAQNLKSSSFTGTFTSGVTFASTGVTGNGTSAYFNTAYNPVTQSDSQTSFYMSVYIRTNSNAGNPYDIGNSLFASAGTKFTGIITRYNSDRQYISVADPYGTQNASTDSRGFYSGGTNGSTTQILYKNGTNVLSGTSAQQGFESSSLWVLAANDTAGFPTFSNKENAFASIGTGLSPTQNSNLYTAVQAFQTTLSRQV
jgi:hypothetical protein